MNGYIPRIVDAEIRLALESSGAVELRGARACGKTETALQFAASSLRLDMNEPRASLAQQQPSTALAGESPRLLDEWQLVPGLWNEVRRAVDERRASGQFILTRSATLEDDPLRHSGAGRFDRILMRTMSLAETGHSSGAVSLSGLFDLKDGQQIPVTDSPIEFSDVIDRLVVGGWPGWWDASAEVAARRIRSYLADITERDYRTLTGASRDPRRFLAYLRAVAAMTAQPAAFTALTTHMGDYLAATVGPQAASTLHDLAVRMFLVEDQPAWSPKLRSKTTAGQAPVRHLTDPSLAASLLGATPDRLLAEPNTLGFLFESQVTHDVRVYAQAMGARGVFHFRDTKGRDEIDIIVEDEAGRWLGFEVKLGADAVDKAAANLLRVAAKIERAPSALAVITPTGIAHTRTDGVHVIPLGTLGV